MTVLRVVVVVLAVSVLASCGGDADRVVVSAAASLTDVFAAVEVAFESAHDGTDVVVNVAGSATLREQILEGAPVDVFAPADPSLLDAVGSAGLLGDEIAVVATAPLVVAVPLGNPGGVDGADDFAREDLLIGLCDESVPCGFLARQALAALGVVPSIDTNELSVRSLLTKIESGELDAGVVYRTDLSSSDRVVGLDLLAGSGVEARYAVAVMRDAPNRDGALEFVDFVTGTEGRAILASFGFTAP